MNLFNIDSRRTILRGAVTFCAASFLCACTQVSAPHPDSMQETFFPELTTFVESEQETTAAPDESPFSPEIPTTSGRPLETADLTSFTTESAVTITSREGMLGDYSFIECNETQLFGDYSIAQASCGGESYLMLYQEDIALLATEDGEDAMLFYNGRRLALPFPCYFYMGSSLLRLYEGDFNGSGSRQLALVVPMATGSGVDVEALHLIDLDAMVILKDNTQTAESREKIYALFEEHFAEIGMTREYYLFNYVRYRIQGNEIFVEYGACDADDIYLSFLKGRLSFPDGIGTLHPSPVFADEDSALD